MYVLSGLMCFQSKINFELVDIVITLDIIHVTEKIDTQAHSYGISFSTVFCTLEHLYSTSFVF